MQVFTSIERMALTRPQVVTIGVFDGVHRGHQFLIAQAAASAARRQAEVTAITFWPPPVAVLRPEHPVRALMLAGEKIDALAALGQIDHLLVLPFTHEFSRLGAAEFLDLLRERVPLVALVEGDDFTLGHNREGNVAWLAAYGQTHGFAVESVAKRALGGEPVSSTRIRDLIEAGDARAAADLLSRPYHLAGTVAHGEARGRALGFPTANLAVDRAKLIPADGIYATRAWTDGNERAPWAGVASIGVRPTFAGRDRRVEVHLMDVAPDLYGATLHVTFIDRLREERRFDSTDALIAQMGRDVSDARARLAADTEGAWA